VAIVMIPAVVVYLPDERHVVAGLTGGGVKG
jgi:ABC-type glycerol-3-phosphate transport system permease component